MSPDSQLARRFLYLVGPGLSPDGFCCKLIPINLYRQNNAESQAAMMKIYHGFFSVALKSAARSLHPIFPDRNGRNSWYDVTTYEGGKSMEHAERKYEFANAANCDCELTVHLNKMYRSNSYE